MEQYKTIYSYYTSIAAVGNPTLVTIR